MDAQKCRCPGIFYLKRYIIYIYPPKGRAERTQWGPLDSLSNLICVWETKIGLSKTPSRIGLFWNLKNLYCTGGWVGGWVGIKRVLRFCSISSMLTSKMRWFQIWPQKLSTAIRLKVMSNLILKFWDFKVDFRGGNGKK